jgi:hypothetical protein
MHDGYTCNDIDNEQDVKEATKHFVGVCMVTLH